MKCEHEIGLKEVHIFFIVRFFVYLQYCIFHNFLLCFSIRVLYSESLIME
jgi:hypothetical protein